VNKTINLAILLASMILVSCAHANKNQQDNFLREWESSGSACLDGLIVNMAAAGCHEINTTKFPMGGTVELKCANPRLNNPEYPYLSNTFIVTPMIAMLPNVSEPVCSDAQLVVGVINTWESAPTETPPMSLPPTKPKEAPGNTQNQKEQ
jgi:hypothetical protein